ncbi:hypothetical protein ARMSODRAFT_1064737, partial [Armillaria solidipes]
AVATNARIESRSLSYHRTVINVRLERCNKNDLDRRRSIHREMKKEARYLQHTKLSASQNRTVRIMNCRSPKEEQTGDTVRESDLKDTPRKNILTGQRVWCRKKAHLERPRLVKKGQSTCNVTPLLLPLMRQSNEDQRLSVKYLDTGKYATDMDRRPREGHESRRGKEKAHSNPQEQEIQISLRLQRKERDLTLTNEESVEAWRAGKIGKAIRESEVRVVLASFRAAAKSERTELMVLIQITGRLKLPVLDMQLSTHESSQIPILYYFDQKFTQGEVLGKKSIGFAKYGDFVVQTPLLGVMIYQFGSVQGGVNFRSVASQSTEGVAVTQWDRDRGNCARVDVEFEEKQYKI